LDIRCVLQKPAELGPCMKRVERDCCRQRRNVEIFIAL